VSALVAFEPLFSDKDVTMLDRLGRLKKGAGWHGSRKAKNSTPSSLHLEPYQARLIGLA
jgi:hypothetical protein